MEVTRLSDNCTGHDACPPRPLITASENVIVNGRGCGRIGDMYTTHSCRIHAPHVGFIVTGSATVIVNGAGIGRVGDMVDCGSLVGEGSADVLAG